MTGQFLRDQPTSPQDPGHRKPPFRGEAGWGGRRPKPACLPCARFPPPPLMHFIGAQTVKNLWKTWVQSLSWKDPLEQGMVTHSSILARRIPWTEESGLLESMGYLSQGSKPAPQGLQEPAELSTDASTPCWYKGWQGCCSAHFPCVLAHTFAFFFLKGVGGALECRHG